MKRNAAAQDPLEETMQNPDLPPVVAAVASTRVPARRPTGRRNVRLMLLLGAFLAAGVLVARLIS